MPDFSQPGVINALDYGLTPNEPSAAIANATSLANAIAAAQASCADSGYYGGIVMIPSNDLVPGGGGEGDGGAYYFASEIIEEPAINITCQYPVLILGTGSGTKLIMTTNSDLFLVSNAGSSGATGLVSFQDLQIYYQEGLTSGAGIRVTGDTQNVRLFRMTFVECPVAVALDESLQCSMIDCLVWNEQNDGSGVTLGVARSNVQAKETYIAGCVFEANTPANGSGTAITAIHVDHLRVVNTRIQGYAQGVAIIPSVGDCNNLFFENVTPITILLSSSSTGGAGLLIQPSGSGSVAQAVFVGCEFGQTLNTTQYTGPGILVDASLTSGAVDQVRFVSCWSCGWPGHGMQINGNVTQLEVIGGTYSCNGQVFGGAPPPQPTGILITSPGSGARAGMRIIGAACNNSVYNNEGSAYLPAMQDVGISIGSGGGNIAVRHCDVTGNNTVGLQATSPTATVSATDCSGYNDVATPLASVVPTSGLTFYPYSYENYAGPAALYVSGGSGVSVTINGVDTGLAQGGFTLGKGESAAVKWGSAPAFYMVGK